MSKGGVYFILSFGTGTDTPNRTSQGFIERLGKGIVRGVKVRTRKSRPEKVGSLYGSDGVPET